MPIAVTRWRLTDGMIYELRMRAGDDLPEDMTLFIPPKATLECLDGHDERDGEWTATFWLPFSTHPIPFDV